MATNAYCVKCKAKREMQNEQKITMKNGKPATEGKCPVCGTKMFRDRRLSQRLAHSIARAFGSAPTPARGRSSSSRLVAARRPASGPRYNDAPGG